MHHPQSQEEVHCPGQTHCAQSLSLTTLSWSSMALNTLIHAALTNGSLGIIGGTLNAESLHSDYSVRVEMEFLITNEQGDELMGILFDGDDAWPFNTNNSK